MKAGAGKRKGSQFEREICRVISLFWSNGQYKDLCWRSAASGGRGTTFRVKKKKLNYTVRRSKVKGYYGDLVATSPLIEALFKIFCIECKFYKKIDITELLRGLKNNKVMEFWRQAVVAARHSDRIPILITRQNFLGTLLIMEKDQAFVFRGMMHKLPKYMTLGDKLIILNFDDVLKYIDQKKFRRFVETLAEEKELNKKCA